jgi:hypothetical protein
MPNHRSCVSACVLLIALAAAPLLAPAATYIYLRPEWSESQREPYGMALLKLAFAKAGVCHQLVFSGHDMKQGRGALELEIGSGKVDIMDTMTSPAREAALLAIPIPLTKGLLGWRISLVRADRTQQFAAVRSIRQLGGFVAGQGHDWPDTGILRANGLNVHQSASYPGLFGMLEAGRIDYFPRGVQQVWDERTRHPALAVEPHLLLKYRTDAYFFVNKHNVRLAAEVRRGLEAAIADGSFDRLFYRYFARQIAAARLDRRRILELENGVPHAPAGVQRPELWFSPDELKRKAFSDALKRPQAKTPPNRSCGKALPR